MTTSTNVHLLRPVFTIQGDTGLKVENILSRFLPANKWKKKSQILCFLGICRSQFRALSNYLQLKFFLVSLICFRNHHTGSMVPDLHVLPCFSHIIMNLWNVKSVSREMYTFLEVKLYGVSGEKLTRSMISEIRILLLANSSNDSRARRHKI